MTASASLPLPKRPSRVLKKFSSHEEQEIETFRYWRGKSVAEKMEATAELVRDGYALRGIFDAPGSERTLTRV